MTPQSYYFSSCVYTFLFSKMKFNHVTIPLFISCVWFCKENIATPQSPDTYSVKPDELLVVIRNLHSTESKTKAESIKTNLLQQSSDLLDVLMLHEKWADVNAWTVLPMLEHLYSTYKNKAKWIFLCEDTTEIDLGGLLNVLSRFNSKETYFLGHSLHDSEPAIIHHFAFHQDPSVFQFPDFDAGWALSISLLETTAKKLAKDAPAMGFSIDVKHEVAMYLFEDGKGTRLTDIMEFCINKPLKKDGCVSTIQYAEPSCGETSPDDILIAVKTCEKFHQNRVPVVQKTVGVHAKHIRYYSDVEDASIPTEYIGVNNTKSGHCQKLHNIIKKSTNKELKNIPWLVVIDDDTIMSYKRLQKLLSCYDHNVPILLGERYGYGVNYRNFGYSYPTGGGGMVLSRAGIEMLLQNGCECSSVGAPDDMWLGSCFRHISPMVHTNSFHQARPSQYNKEFLSHRFLVSFHKHFQVDPMQVYHDYLVTKKMKKAINDEL